MTNEYNPDGKEIRFIDSHYHGSISMSEDVNRQLEDLYVKFNIDHPDDFRGHSMSVSDIVALKVVGEVSFHYVDSVGVSEAGKL